MKHSLKENFFSRSTRAQFISSITCIFALLYHIAFLFVFHHLNIEPMFYYNFLSIIIFSTSFATIIKSKSAIIPYTICAIEVFIHQISAEYYLGSDSSFKFFILLMGIIPLFVFNNKYFFSIPFAILSAILFSVLSIFSNQLSGTYEINPQTLKTIKIANIVLSTGLMFVIMIIFTFLMNLFENQLEEKVSIQTKDLLYQSEKIINMQNNTIISLSNLVESRDSDTGDHVLRTSAYVKMLAEQVRKNGYYLDTLSDSYIELLTKAAPMHDIGKIIVPDSILKKPGKLTPEEFEIIKKHTSEGRRIVLDVLGNNENNEYIQMAGDVAEFHHEKWDGSGYPKHLREEQIPLSARLMAVADVFDALVSPRCYKKPIPIDQALLIMQKSSGEHFDPILIKCFLEIKDPVTELLAIYNQ